MIKWLEDGVFNGERLIAKYIATGVSWDSSQITVDTTADTLTITSHGLVNGDTVGFGVSGDINNNEAPRVSGQTSGTTLYVINATTNTFQLSASNGGAVLDITANNGSGWKLFKNNVSTITFSNINYKKIRLKLRGWAFVGSGASRVSVRRAGASNVNNFAMPVSSSGRPDFFDGDIIMEVNNTGGLYTVSIKGQANVRGQLSGGGVNIATAVWGYSERYTSDPVNLGTVDVTIFGVGSINAGSTVEVYALE